MLLNNLCRKVVSIVGFIHLPHFQEKGDPDERSIGHLRLQFSYEQASKENIQLELLNNLVLRQMHVKESCQETEFIG